MTYRTATTYIFSTAAAVWLAFPCSAPAAGSGSGSQVEFYTDTYHKNAQGSDSSLQNSSVSAMQALMDLASGKITGAVKNGYDAYSKYRNSENLDRLKDQNAQLANSMGSAGSAPVLPTTITNTSFRRLDTTFLHQGEAGKVAGEFEKQTGMKRETFLTQMADVSEQKIKRSDPMMIDKAFSRFESFLEKIPNQEFRKNAEKTIAQVPDTMRRGMVAQAVQKLAGMFAATGPGAAPMEPTIADLNKAKLADANVAAASGALGGAVTGAGALGKDAKKDDAASRDPASALAGSHNLPQQAGAESAVAAALAAQGSQEGQGGDNTGITLFQQVTKRYRILSPLLLRAP